MLDRDEAHPREPGAYGKPTPALTASSNPFQFTGREHDPGGLYFMRNRYYSPTLSRFVSSDPIGFGGGDVNLLRYAGNDPLNLVDPLGLGARSILAAGTGIAPVLALCTTDAVETRGTMTAQGVSGAATW